jgi:hypothetical protein
MRGAALAEGLGGLSAVALVLLGPAWRQSIGDTLFVEGAILLVIGGVLDLGRSITFQQIRRRPRIGEAPPSVQRPGRLFILVIAGLLLCGQGFLLVRLLAPGGG